MQSKNKYTFVQAGTGLTVTVVASNKEYAVSKLGHEVGFKGDELPMEWRLSKIEIR